MYMSMQDAKNMFYPGLPTDTTLNTNKNSAVQLPTARKRP